MCWEKLRRAFEDEYCRYCAKASQGSVCYAYVIEEGPLGGMAHLHALLYGTSSIDCTKMAEAWNHGRAEVVVFDPMLGGTHYSAKQIGTSSLHYDVSSRMPPRRVG